MCVVQVLPALWGPNFPTRIVKPEISHVVGTKLCVFVCVYLWGSFCGYGITMSWELGMIAVHSCFLTSCRRKNMMEEREQVQRILVPLPLWKLQHIQFLQLSFAKHALELMCLCGRRRDLQEIVLLYNWTLLKWGVLTEKRACLTCPSSVIIKPITADTLIQHLSSHNLSRIYTV